jgi:hypothetical protein
MTSLVAPAEVRVLINTGLSDANLQTVIERVEAQITAKIGAPQTDLMATTVTKVMRGEGNLLFMPTEIYEVVSITEDLTLLTSDQYQTWSGGVIERLPSDSKWGERMTVVYKPTDDRLARAEVIINLVRLVLERTAMKSENIAGEYSFTAPDNWEAEFHKAMRRLTFKAV